MRRAIAKIDRMLPALIEFDEKKKNEAKKDRIIEIVILVSVAMIGAFLGGIAGYFLGRT